jgi:hypothetical protein
MYVGRKELSYYLKHGNLAFCFSFFGKLNGGEMSIFTSFLGGLDEQTHLLMRTGNYLLVAKLSIQQLFSIYSTLIDYHVLDIILVLAYIHLNE